MCVTSPRPGSPCSASLLRGLLLPHTLARSRRPHWGSAGGCSSVRFVIVSLPACVKAVHGHHFAVLQGCYQKHQHTLPPAHPRPQGCLSILSALFFCLLLSLFHITCLYCYFSPFWFSFFICPSHHRRLEFRLTAQSPPHCRHLPVLLSTAYYSSHCPEPCKPWGPSHRAQAVTLFPV